MTPSRLLIVLLAFNPLASGHCEGSWQLGDKRDTPRAEQTAESGEREAKAAAPAEPAPSDTATASARAQPSAEPQPPAAAEPETRAQPAALAAEPEPPPRKERDRRRAQRESQRATPAEPETAQPQPTQPQPTQPQPAQPAADPNAGAHASVDEANSGRKNPHGDKDKEKDEDKPDGGPGDGPLLFAENDPDVVFHKKDGKGFAGVQKITMKASLAKLTVANPGARTEQVALSVQTLGGETAFALKQSSCALEPNQQCVVEVEIAGACGKSYRGTLVVERPNQEAVHVPIEANKPCLKDSVGKESFKPAAAERHEAPGPKLEPGVRPSARKHGEVAPRVR